MVYEKHKYFFEMSIVTTCRPSAINVSYIYIYIYTVYTHQIETKLIIIQSESYLNFFKFLLQITYSKVIIYSSCVQILIYKKSEDQLHIHYIDES